MQNLGDLPSSSREHTEQAKEQENTLYSKSVYLMTEAKHFWRSTLFLFCNLVKECYVLQTLFSSQWYLIPGGLYPISLSIPHFIENKLRYWVRTDEYDNYKYWLHKYVTRKEMSFLLRSNSCNQNTQLVILKFII